MEIHRLGQSNVQNRALYMAEVADVAHWPEDAGEPESEFVAFTAFDAGKVTASDLAGFAQKLVRQGCVYLCAWGPGCERVHDAVDLADTNANGPKGAVMTTWHDDEPLDDALYFALFETYAETEPSAFLALSAPTWGAEVERRLRDPDALRQEILARGKT